MQADDELEDPAVGVGREAAADPRIEVDAVALCVEYCVQRLAVPPEGAEGAHRPQLVIALEAKLRRDRDRPRHLEVDVEGRRAAARGEAPVDIRVDGEEPRAAAPAEDPLELAVDGRLRHALRRVAELEVRTPE